VVQMVLEKSLLHLKPGEKVFHFWGLCGLLAEIKDKFQLGSDMIIRKGTVGMDTSRASMYFLRTSRVSSCITRPLLERYTDS